jgi:nucleoside-diphosphate-sugar epimerase
MKARQVLVTGGLGFIGSCISECLASHENRVTVVDSCVSSVVEPGELSAGAGSISYITQDLEDFLAAESLAGFDLVVHCASYVGPASILRYAGQIAPAIVGSTAALIERCIAADVPLLNFSSAEVYGRSGVLYENEDLHVSARYNPRTEYALGKLAGEAMCINSKSRGLRSIVVRPFNAAGPRQSRLGGFVMPTFVQQALKGRPLTVFASGRQRRAFIAVSDLCYFITEFVDDAIFEQPMVYNLGNPANEIGIWELAERIKSTLESESEIIHVDAKAIYGPQYEECESFEKLPDITNASRLGWQPRIGLDELIEETIDHYRLHADTRAAGARL